MTRSRAAALSFKVAAKLPVSVVRWRFTAFSLSDAEAEEALGVGVVAVTEGMDSPGAEPVVQPAARTAAAVAQGM
ncbi:hypothetical protein ACWCXX_33915 [Streptomyces sp. NPDC001732]